MGHGAPAALRKVVRVMRDLDYCLFTTHTARAGLRTRPMSNNREVGADGTLWFFTAADSRKVAELEARPRVHLSFIDVARGRYIALDGRASIVRNVRQKQALWLPELARWFDDGPDDDGVVLIRVKPTAIRYWTPADAGELTIR